MSTPVSPKHDVYEARAKLRAFGVAVEALLASHWPDEHAGESMACWDVNGARRYHIEARPGPLP